MTSFLINLCEFIKDSGNLLLLYPFQIIVLILLCIAIISGIYDKVINKINEKVIEKCDKINELNQKINELRAEKNELYNETLLQLNVRDENFEILSKECDNLKNQNKELHIIIEDLRETISSDINKRLLMDNSSPNSKNSSVNVSRHIQEKYSKSDDLDSSK